MEYLFIDWSEYYSNDKERCGVILSSGEIIELPNVSPTPEASFEISDEDLSSIKEPVIATWHTHCGDDPNLSLEDYAMFLEHKELSHYIISLNNVTRYGVEDRDLLLLGVSTR